jgi:DNA-binding response OmpR family regulator
MNNLPFQSRPKVLVADDTRDIADVYCMLLASAGYQVSRAYDGLTAFSLAKVTKPDVAILNHGMPGMTGLQVLTELREAGVSTPVIITSATNAFNELAFRAVAEGAVGAMQQPCQPHQLLNMLGDRTRGFRAGA